MDSAKTDQSRPAVAAILSAVSRGIAAELADLEATKGQASARLRERIRYIVDRPAASMVITPLTGGMRGPEEWRRLTGQAFTDLRLTTLPTRPRIQYEDMLIRSTIREIAMLRIGEACRGVMDASQRVIWKLGQVAGMKREPWAPSSHPVNR